MKKLFLILYGLFLLSFSIFSYLFVDPNLIYLSNLYTGFAFNNREITTVIYLIGIIIFFIFYISFIQFGRNKLLNKRGVVVLITITTLSLLFSYPAMLSYDIFNYISTAKVAFFYHENPYIIMPIEFINDPLLSFTHAANKIALYGPFWILLSVIPFSLGFGNFLIILFSFKFLNILFYIGTLYFIWKISKKNISLIIFGLNPLVIIETMVSGHNDTVMMFLAIASLFFLIKKKIWSGLLTIILSVLIKYSTLFLIPIYFYGIFQIIKNKNLNIEKFIYFSAISMFLIFLLSPLREEIYPWYAIWFLVFTALIPEKKIIFYLSISLSFGLLLRYIPFMFLGTHFEITPVLKTLFLFFPSLILLIFFYSKKILWSRNI
ncbi:MAG: hypothetical protein HYT08_01470 [Candidatus Levybacteria bacterium]|nr:hypothetical protein [Candidatus Levybacteria bacterium]